MASVCCQQLLSMTPAAGAGRCCAAIPNTPCLQVAPELHSRAAFSHIQFSSDGKLLLCVAEGHVYQLDAFAGIVFCFPRWRLMVWHCLLTPVPCAGALLQTYSTGIPEGTRGPAAIFSPDSRYILSGMLQATCTMHEQKHYMQHIQGIIQCAMYRHPCSFCSMIALL